MATEATAIDASESRASTVIAGVSLLLIVTTVVTGLRLYTRAVVLKTTGYDDAAAIVALCLVVTCGCLIAGNTINGLGRHVSTLTPNMITNYMEAFYLSIVFYNASLLAVKMTFLLQYRRVFTVRYMRRIVLVALAIIGGWSTSILLVAIFTCTPIAGFWDHSINAKCVPNQPFWYINAAGNIITDVAIFLLPLPVIRTLKLAQGQKLVLVGIFSLGFFTTAISILRIQFLHLSTDFTWDNVDPAIWSVAEPACGVICACLPTLRPLVAKVIPALSTSKGGSSGRTATGGYYKSSRKSVGGSQLAMGTLRSQKLGAHANGIGSKEILYQTTSSFGDGSRTPVVETRIIAEGGEMKASGHGLVKEVEVRREVHIVKDRSEMV